MTQLRQGQLVIYYHINDTGLQVIFVFRIMIIKWYSYSNCIIFPDTLWLSSFKHVVVLHSSWCDSSANTWCQLVLSSMWSTIIHNDMPFYKPPALKCITAPVSAFWTFLSNRNDVREHFISFTCLLRLGSSSWCKRWHLQTNCTNCSNRFSPSTISFCYQMETLHFCMSIRFYCLWPLVPLLTTDWVALQHDW